MKQNFKILFLLLIAIVPLRTMAQDDVRFEINDGIYNNSVKSKMENTVSDLLSEMNKAFKQNRALRLDGMAISNDGKKQINMLWDNVHLYCSEPEIVEHGITTNQGFQIRNIPFIMQPVGEDESKQEYQEVVMDFSKAGLLESFYLTIGMNMYSQVMANKTEVSDVRRRMEILDYVEHFRTSYNQKDMNFLRQVFSNDALIITGRVIKVQKSDVFPGGNKIIYTKQTKQQYLANLARAFKTNKYIKVNFDDIKVVAHPTKANVYGVTVHQTWNSSRYSDEGYVFMIWDFTNEDEPKIHVRTWQPDYIDKAHKQKLPENEVFDLGDFDLGDFID